MLKNKSLIDSMTLPEKVSLLSGSDMWHTQAIDRLAIPSIMMCDGPHGLRKQENYQIGSLYASSLSTCFPPACLSACSWDNALLESMGDAIGAECNAEKVAIVLGPGANIKRSPLCGRNFEYFSEDPLLSGTLAGSWIKGVENRGIGTSLKHFACNNQEYMRMISDSIVDERALRDIYLRPFEIAVKKANPATIMCSYNRINGTYASENGYLMNDILRKKWGYDGLVVSDWGAVDTRPLGISAGLDLEMPSSGGMNDKLVMNAISSGTLSIDALDKAVDNVLEIVKRGAKLNDITSIGISTADKSLNQCEKIADEKAARISNNADNGNEGTNSYSVAAHHELAARVAEESMVLLQNNDSILPLCKAVKTLVIGELASIPRYQGGGSSHITPHKVTSLIDGLAEIGADCDYLRGYDIKSTKPNRRLIAEAVRLAPNYKQVVLCVGLTDECESEGFDRKNIDMPLAHLTLINSVLAVSPNAVINIVCGSPVATPFRSKCKSILLSYLGGQAAGLATARLIMGDRIPCGKLAESFPDKLSDTPCYAHYYHNSKFSLYKESIFVGYRYYASARVATAYPFGHGLSYSKFSYSNLSITGINTAEIPRSSTSLAAVSGSSSFSENEDIIVNFTVTNCGSMAAQEISQVYISKCSGEIFAPTIELKGYKKTLINIGESALVSITINASTLGYYDSVALANIVEGGDYVISVGGSSVTRPLRATITISATATPQVSYDKSSWYYNPRTNIVPIQDFARIYGNLPSTRIDNPRKGEFTDNHCFDDMREHSKLARRIISISGWVIRKFIVKTDKLDTGYLMMHEMLYTSPLKKLAFSSQGAFSVEMVGGLLVMLNGKFFRGIRQILKNIPHGKKLQL